MSQYRPEVVLARGDHVVIRGEPYVSGLRGQVGTITEINGANVRVWLDRPIDAHRERQWWTLAANVEKVQG